MSFKNKNQGLEDEFIYKPTLEEAKRVLKEMGSGTFEQYLVKEGIIRLDEHKRRVVRDPKRYTEANQLEGLVEWQREKDLEQFHQAYPEEKVAHEKRIADIRGQMKMLVRRMKV